MESYLTYWRRQLWLRVLDGWIGLQLIVLAYHIRFVAVASLSKINLTGDMVHYDHAATTLLSLHRFTYWNTAPSAQVTPGYPLFLELMYVLTPYSGHAGQVMYGLFGQAALSAVVAGVLYFISRRGMGPLAAAAVGLIWAYYPPAVWSVRLLLTETLFTFMLIVYLAAWLGSIQRFGRNEWLLTGLLLGGTALVRPTVMPLVAVPLGLWLWQRLRPAEKLRPWLQAFTWQAVGFVVVMIPWWVRNLLTLHRLILASEDAGNPLLYGSDPRFPNGPDLGAGLTAPAQTALAVHRIVNGFLHHPWIYLKWYTFDKLQLLFRQPWYPTGASGGVLLHAHLVWVVLGAMGLLLCALDPYMRWVMWLAAFLVLVQLPFIPISRYVFPVMPLFLVGVGWLLQRLVQAASRLFSFSIPYVTLGDGNRQR